MSACERAVRRVETTEKVVALTLDDGPDPKYTPFVLDLARKHHLPLTFFLIGKHVRQHPELARRIAREGHVIGNHTWSHRIMLGLLESEDLAEISSCGAEIEKVCGHRPTLFRPPKGKLDDNTVRAAASLGYTVVLWSVAIEHSEDKTATAMAHRVLQRVQPGAIILAHDGRPYECLSRDKTMEALAILVDELQEQGYRFLTVPELLALPSQESLARQNGRR